VTELKGARKLNRVHWGEHGQRDGRTERTHLPNPKNPNALTDKTRA